MPGRVLVREGVPGKILIGRGVLSGTNGEGVSDEVLIRKGCLARY